MKISDLIEKLQGNLEFYGDLPVVVRNDMTGKCDQTPAVVYDDPRKQIALI